MTNPVIPAEAVEAAAKVLMNVSPFKDEYELWQVPSIRDYYLTQTRAALEAAAPYMLAAAWDQGWYERAQYDGAQQLPTGDEENPYKDAGT